jgi:hypothetical protein
VAMPASVQSECSNSCLSLNPNILTTEHEFSEMANPKMVHTEPIDFLECNTANVNSLHSKWVLFTGDGLGKNARKGMRVNEREAWLR